MLGAAMSVVDHKKYLYTDHASGYADDEKNIKYYKYLGAREVYDAIIREYVKKEKEDG